MKFLICNLKMNHSLKEMLSYKKYLELKPQTQDRADVEAQISYLEETALKYARKYELAESPDTEGED